eukprot:GSMAST32.ASY1.ANO1.1577.1 assembled CDS
MTSLISIVFVLCAASVNGISLRSGFPHGCTSDDKSFNYFELVMQYPPAFSQNIAHFTLHGLWPSREGKRVKSYPCNCENDPFNVSKLKPIMHDMEEYWPSFSTLPIHSNSGFWSHEWTKHGTCALYENLPSIKSELDYFSTALKLRSEANLKQLMVKNEIVVGKSYSLDALSTVFEAGTGFRVTMGCKFDDSTQYLSEVGVCYDMQLKRVSCDISVDSPEGNSCDAEEKVFIKKANSTPNPNPKHPSKKICVKNKKGPKCFSNEDCVSKSGCIRCSHHGFCTSVPLVEPIVVDLYLEEQPEAII